MAAALAAALLAILVGLRLLKPSWFCIALFASLPWFGLFVDVGVALEPYKLFAIAFFLTIFATPRARWRRALVAHVVVYLLMALILSALMPTPPYEAFVIADPGLLRRPEYRWIVQSGTLTLLLGLFIAPQVSFSSIDEIATALSTFVLSASLQAVLAIVQFLWYLATGVDLFPIQRFGVFGEVEASALMDAGGYTIVRACGLAREPKDLAVLMVVTLTILLAMDGPLERVALLRRRVVYATCLGLSMGALLLTFSTTGAFLLPIAITVVFFCGRRIRGRTPRAALGCIAIVAILVVFGQQRDGEDAVLQDLAQSRVIDRFGDLEEYDEITLEYFAENPVHALTGTGRGNLPLLAAPITARAALDYVDVPTWSPKAGLLDIIATAGVAGLLVIGALCAVLIRRGWRVLTRVDAAEAPVYLLFVLTLYIVVAHALRGHEPHFWSFLGLFAASAGVARNDNSTEVRGYA